MTNSLFAFLAMAFCGAFITATIGRHLNNDRLAEQPGGIVAAVAFAVLFANSVGEDPFGAPLASLLVGLVVGFAAQWAALEFWRISQGWNNQP